jgi:hypothetical protein
LEEEFMQNNVVGIDVSKKKLDICMIFDGQTRKKVVTNDEPGFKWALQI